MGTKVLELLARYAPRIFPEYYNPDCCIAGTAIAIDVLAEFGIKAKPFPTRLMVFNRIFVDIIVEKGLMSFEDAMKINPNAYSVGVGFGEKREGGYLGHLVAVTSDNTLVDLTITQANRPQYGIVCHPVISVVDDNFLSGKDKFIIHSTSGILAVYEKLDNDAYLVSKDWTLVERRKEIVQRLVKRIRNH